MGVGWGRRTTHLAFGEVAGAEGSFYPLAVSREHLEKTESRESESCSVVSDSLQPHGLYSPWNSPGQNTGVGSLSLLRGIFPTQGSNPGLLHFRQILYQLSHLIVCHGYKKWKMAAQMPSVFHPCSVKMVLLGTSLVIQ